jgi:hypothetical protein
MNGAAGGLEVEILALTFPLLEVSFALKATEEGDSAPVITHFTSFCARIDVLNKIEKIRITCFMDSIFLVNIIIRCDYNVNQKKLFFKQYKTFNTIT